MMKPMKYESGMTFEFPYPFVRDEYSAGDGEGGWATYVGWRPGIQQVPIWDDVKLVAHGMGSQILTVVGTYKPGKFPERVFFTRNWRDPQGRVFGKDKLRILSAGAFTRQRSGYRHRYTVEDSTSPAQKA
jgi:hypothetical protein